MFVLLRMYHIRLECHSRTFWLSSQLFHNLIFSLEKWKWPFIIIVIVVMGWDCVSMELQLLTGPFSVHQMMREWIWSIYGVILMGKLKKGTRNSLKDYRSRQLDWSKNMKYVFQDLINQAGAVVIHKLVFERYSYCLQILAVLLAILVENFVCLLSCCRQMSRYYL